MAATFGGAGSFLYNLKWNFLGLRSRQATVNRSTPDLGRPLGCPGNALAVGQCPIQLFHPESVVIVAQA